MQTANLGLFGQLNQRNRISQKTLACRVNPGAGSAIEDGNLTAGIDRVLQDDNYE